MNPQLNPSPPLQHLLRVIAAVAPGFYLVGGAVRDLLRGVDPADIDIVVPGDAAAAAAAIAEGADGSAFPLDEERQQYRVALRTPAGIVTQVDVSAIDGGLEADLRSRDFTVNAMAAGIDTEGSLTELVDPTSGFDDLQSRSIRLIAVENLREDPLRLLRAARIATQLGFEVEAATAGVIQAMAAQLAPMAPERQREELVRLLATPRAAKGVRLLDALGLLKVLLPELEPAKGVGQPGEHHYYDVFDHSVECLAALDALVAAEPVDDGTGILALRETFDEVLDWYPVHEYLDAKIQSQQRGVLLKLAGLLHDVSKPETKSVGPDGKVHFFGHPEKGATKTEAICRRLRFGNGETAFVSLLVEEHLRPTMLAKPGEPPSRRALYRFFRDLGEAGPACLVLMLADGAAAAGPRLTRQSWLRRTGYVSYVLERYEEISRVQRTAPRLVTGHDLIHELSLREGPELGRLMHDINEAIGAGEVTTREAAIDYAKALLSGAEEKRDG